MKSKLSFLLHGLVPLALFALVFPAMGAEHVAGKTSLDGKKLFTETYSCNRCHSVSEADIQAKAKSDKMKGPDLSGYTSGKSISELAAFLGGSAASGGKKHMKVFTGSEQELQALVDWLLEQKAEKE
jgi:hypothetical protein